ncbi:MAG: hypothetical protein MZW92_14770 [Comamonadaceae bacterium]|nr:hypothetical protein [Comamonadaceae bacterium]
MERHTDLTRHRMVIIDDASTDPDVTPLLEALRGARLGDAVLLLPSSARRGFVRSCNVGMRVSARDVILLNTDTVVTAGWVEQARRRVVLGAPGWRAPRRSPNHAVSRAIDPAVLRHAAPSRRVSTSRATPRWSSGRRCAGSTRTSPTARVSACTCGERRWTRCGLFDEETFGLGYGEECDWSYRACRPRVAQRHSTTPPTSTTTAVAASATRRRPRASSAPPRR